MDDVLICQAVKQLDCVPYCPDGWFVHSLVAYSYSRRQPLDAVVDPGQVGEPQPDVQMCYALRRGELTLDRLGGEEGVICRQVGHLFPGLGTANHSSPSAKNPHNFVPIFLNVSVRYRGSLDDMGLLQECLVSYHCYSSYFE